MTSETWFGATAPTTMSRPTQPPIQLSMLPTIKGKKAAHAWIAEELGVALTLNHVVTAANKRQIPRRIIKGAIYFSTQDLYDWVMAVAGEAEVAS
jgi:hypothetical protein